MHTLFFTHIFLVCLLLLLFFLSLPLFPDFSLSHIVSLSLFFYLSLLLSITYNKIPWYNFAGDIHVWPVHAVCVLPNNEMLEQPIQRQAHAFDNDTFSWSWQRQYVGCNLPCGSAGYRLGPWGMPSRSQISKVFQEFIALRIIWAARESQRGFIPHLVASQHATSRCYWLHCGCVRFHSPYYLAPQLSREGLESHYLVSMYLDQLWLDLR